MGRSLDRRGATVFRLDTGAGGQADDRARALALLERDAVIVACAISAGIHAALTPQHFVEEPGAGLCFAVAAALLGALAAGLTWRPVSVAALAGTAVVLAALLVSYGLAITTGLPPLHPEAEPVDGLALATKAIEAVGLLAAVHLLWRGRAAVEPPSSRPKGT